MPTVEYSEAPSVRKIAATLIPEHHKHLEGARIEYVFRSKHSTNKGKIVAGKARKISGLNAFLASNEIHMHLKVGDEGAGAEIVSPSFGGLEFFCIEIAQDIWEALPEKQRIALVDHELCHCFREINDDTGEWMLSIRPHDVEEFAEIVQRHGLWSSDLDHFVEQSQQLRLIS